VNDFKDFTSAESLRLSLTAHLDKAARNGPR